MPKGKRFRPNQKWFGVSIVAFVFLIFVIGAYLLIGGKSRDTYKGNIGSVKSDIEHIPGGKGTPEYNDKLRQKNRQETDQARKTGHSHVSTVIGGTQKKSLNSSKSNQKDQNKKDSRNNEQRHQRKEFSVKGQSSKDKLSRHNSKTFNKKEQQKIETIRAAYVKQLQNIWEEKSQDISEQSVIVYKKVAYNKKKEKVKKVDNDRQHKKTHKKMELNTGDILYARNNLKINSDVPSPIQATVISGKYKGSKVFGQFERHETNLLIKFNKMVFTNGRVAEISAMAIDPDTPKSVVRSRVNRHMLSRWGGLIASSFLEGFGEAVSESGATVVSDEGQTDIYYPDLNTNEQLWSAAGDVGNELSNKFSQNFDRPPTVYLDEGTLLGVLILETS